MINPHGINGVLGKRWCSKRRKRTRKAVVSSSKKKAVIRRNEFRLQEIHLEIFHQPRKGSTQNENYIFIPFLRFFPSPSGRSGQNDEEGFIICGASGWIRTTRHILVDKWQRISPTGFPLKFCAREPLQASFLAYIVSWASRFFNLFQKKDSTVGWVCRFYRRRHFPPLLF